ncbi:hypothetical protein BGW38_008682 [Lunasporangiospora selenospora]|uniref:Protein kinase domain-containing protein n=1 Tax=Lunasporangiospora selenospora TaxID=979761 RepID=A0A9P6FKD9_9FUNG|nr:hypothetical protein BGW38_008682 [Lunasporangiospora selenospora]
MSVFGRNPWKQACPRDETFSAFVANTDFLKTILPMSDELNEIIKSVFCLNPKKRISLSELANRVEACKCFTAPEFRASTRKSSTSNSPLTLSPSKAALADAACNPTPATASGEGTAAAAGRTVGTSGEENGKDQGQDSGIDLLSHP